MKSFSVIKTPTPAYTLFFIWNAGEEGKKRRSKEAEEGWGDGVWVNYEL
jgi:hypothetical protein